MPSISSYRRYKNHKTKWRSCNECELCERRKKVVLLRGSVPAPVLFIGEAPGTSEDVLGQPFVGPAGKLLDKIIHASGLGADDYALTNVIACIPKDEEQRKVTEPPKFAVEACRDRLRECVTFCKPDLIVWVGKVAAKQKKFIVRRSVGGTLEEYPYVELIHPAAILRMDISQRGLAIQRSIVHLSDAWDEHVVPF